MSNIYVFAKTIGNINITLSCIINEVRFEDSRSLRLGQWMAHKIYSTSMKLAKRGPGWWRDAWELFALSYREGLRAWPDFDECFSQLPKTR